MCTSYSADGQHIRRHVTTLEQELPDPYIRGVFIDSVGVMWLGTLSGLYIYDGVSYEKFQHEGDVLNYIDNLIPFHDYIIIHDTRSLQIIKTQSQEVVFQSNPNQTFDQVFVVASDQKSYFLFESKDHSDRLVSIDDQGKITKETLVEHDERIVRMAIDEKGGFYFMDILGGIYYAAPDNSKISIDQETFRDWPLLYFPRIIILENDQVCLISNIEGVINRYDIVNNTLKNIKKNIFPAHAFQWLDHDELILCDESRRQLFIYNVSSNSFETQITLPKAINRSFLLYQDNAGHIWIPYESSLGSGLYIALNDEGNFNSIQYHSTSDSVEAVRIRDMERDFKGNILVSGLDGFFSIDAKKRRLNRMPHKDQNGPFNNLYGLTRDDKNQQIWLSCANQGIYQLNNENQIINHIIPESPEHKITAGIQIDEKQILWIGAWNNITWYDAKNETFLPSKIDSPSFSNVRGYDWIPADSGSMWLCSSNGLFLFDSNRQIKRWYHQESNPALSSNEVFDVKASGSKYLIATNSGLNILEDKTVSVIGVEQGFSSNIIASILLNEDDVWMGTYAGLTQYNQQTGQVKNYFQGDGLPNNEFNRVARYKSTDGNFYFGTQNGIVSFHPDSFQAKKAPKNLVIKSFSRYSSEGEVVLIDPRTLKKNQSIVLPAGNKYFQIEVALLQLINSTENKYAYFLDGLESDWKPLSKVNTIQYNNVPAGDYTIRVKAMDHAGIWSSNQLSIPITVRQHVYKSWWFIALVSLIIFGLLYAFYRMRLAQAIRIERLRTKLSSDLHDDVGSLLSGVAYQMELLEYTVDEKRKPLVQQIASSSRKAMNHMRDVVWAIDSRNDTCLDLFERVSEFATNLLEPLGISYNANINKELRQLRIPSDFRHDILLICKEFLTNTVKHAEANQVVLTISSTRKNIRISMSDNGKGLKNQTIKHTGQGLMNIKMRAKKMKATLKFHHEDGFGIRLILPPF